MEVRFRRRGVVIARASIDGRLLPLGRLPPSVEASTVDGDIVLDESDDPFLECCGQLVFVAVGGGVARTVELDIPPPTPFTDVDLRAMWEAHNRIEVRGRPPTSAEGDWGEARLDPSDAVRLVALPLALAAARRLASDWPQDLTTQHVTLPIDRPGGHVDLRATARRAGPAAIVGARPLPARTIRTFGRRRPRRCSSVAAIAQHLRRRADDVLTSLSVPVEQRRALLAALGTIAERARSASDMVDGPPSTWPPQMLTFYSNAAVALSEVEIVGAGTDSAPLSELWYLYQQWVVERALAHMIGLLGEPNAAVNGSCLGRWEVEGSTVELHAQLDIPARRESAATVCGRPIHAVIGDLIPDLVIASRRHGEDSVRLLVADPKKRAFLDQGTLAVEASKYLWGIRGAHVVAVVLVGPTGGAAAARPEGLASSHLARPEVELTQAAVEGWLARVMS